MIICADKGIAFIHIPKNGGTSVQRQILPFDDLEGRFQRKTDLGAIGRVNLGHLPLEYVETYFPDELAKLRALDVFAILRKPAERFVSALSQRMKEYRKKTLAELSPSEVDDEIAIIREHIFEKPRYPKLPFEHFVPQTAFIFLRDEQLVYHLYTIEQLPQLLRQLSRRLGVRLIENYRLNRTVTFRDPQHRALLTAANDRVKAVLPTRVYFPLKELALKLFTEPGGGKNAAYARERFLSDMALCDYYAADDRLYRETLAATQARELGRIAPCRSIS